MAFEIFNGTASGRTVADMNAIIDKLAEMWTFDSVDTTSTAHSVTYGDCVLSVDNSHDGSINITADGTSIFNSGYIVAFDSPYQYSIVKTDSSVMLSMNYDPGVFVTIIIGTTTNIDGTTGKGMLFADSSASAFWEAGCGSTIQPQDSDTMRSSDTNGLIQLIPYAFSAGGWIVDNAYRVALAERPSNHGLYEIGNDRYYISMRTAIKEE